MWYAHTRVKSLGFPIYFFSAIYVRDTYGDDVGCAGDLRETASDDISCVANVRNTVGDSNIGCVADERDTVVGWAAVKYSDFTGSDVNTDCVAEECDTILWLTAVERSDLAWSDVDADCVAEECNAIVVQVPAERNASAKNDASVSWDFGARNAPLGSDVSVFDEIARLRRACSQKLLWCEELCSDSFPH